MPGSRRATSSCCAVDGPRPRCCCSRLTSAPFPNSGHKTPMELITGHKQHRFVRHGRKYKTAVPCNGTLRTLILRTTHADPSPSVRGVPTALQAERRLKRCCKRHSDPRASPPPPPPPPPCLRRSAGPTPFSFSSTPPRGTASQVLGLCTRSRDAQGTPDSPGDHPHNRRAEDPQQACLASPRARTPVHARQRPGPPWPRGGLQRVRFATRPLPLMAAHRTSHPLPRP